MWVNIKKSTNGAVLRGLSRYSDSAPGGPVAIAANLDVKLRTKALPLS
jgi:hypothetical protein